MTLAQGPACDVLQGNTKTARRVVAATVHEGTSQLSHRAALTPAQFILHLADPNDEGAETLELAFLDVRRLGRIRLCAEPLNEAPISELGFDPILSMPSLEDFTPRVLKRKAPIKAVLLDQSFSAGVGNWVAGKWLFFPFIPLRYLIRWCCLDEILYHARIHPEHRANTLSAPKIQRLHFWIAEVCKIAVSVNADDTKFPDGWLFKHRWVS